MTYESFGDGWWPYVYILVAGWLATDIWRFAGVLLGRRIGEASDAFLLVRAVATALVAAVISQLVLFPSGELAETSLFLRIGAAAAGFVAFLSLGQRVYVGVGTAMLVLIGGIAAGL